MRRQAPLTPDERTLFEELIIASRALVTVSRNAATVLSEEYESMIIGPASAVEAILNRCPTPSEQWDGEFHEADCDIEYYTPDYPAEMRQGRIGAAVKATHRRTKLSVSAEQSADPDVNKTRALRTLQQRVQQYFRAQNPQPREDPLH
jgi:hypothetical protein